MKDSSTSRRDALKALATTVGLAAMPGLSFADTSNELLTEAIPKDKPAFTYCLNMSTIRGQNLGFMKELEIAGKAGFHSVEIWSRTLQTYLDGGGKLADVSKLLKDLDITPENSISFTQWILEDETARGKAIDQLKKEMDMLAQIGCKRIACPPSGAKRDGSDINLKATAERFRAIADIGDSMGVHPLFELQFGPPNLNHLGEALYVVTESGSPSAKLLLDVFHLYKGGSSIDTLNVVNPNVVEVLHMNDYPNIARDVAKDSDRVYPGDGIAPIPRILKTLKSPERSLILSLELFNQTYYAQDALLVCQTGLAKLKAATKDI